jgi:hypothetical protein
MAPNMKANCEVKFLLDTKLVLNEDKTPTKAVVDFFKLSADLTDMNVQFVDTACKDIYNLGWSLRIRKATGDEKWEVTFKKRYPIEAGVDAALNKANSDGFNADAEGYEAQVEWGFTKQTLSVSYEKKASSGNSPGLELPDSMTSGAILVEKAPPKFKDWGGVGWGIGILGTTKVFGPVLAQRYVGEWDGNSVTVEIWPILNEARNGIEHIVEASFKAKKVTTAEPIRAKLNEKLSKEGWLLEKDSLKTQLIMDRYGSSCPTK